MTDTAGMPPNAQAVPSEDRYASPRLIRWWDQEKLASARVMVVGAGALGNEVLKNLALLGIGHLYIVDFDRVERSNLSRSLMFRESDVGRPKAIAAAEAVRALNPDVRVLAFHGDVVHDVGLGIVRRMDLVIGCPDNREARWAVNRACSRLGKPWINGAIEALDGAVKVFLPPDGACYECGLTEDDFRQMGWRTSCLGGQVDDREASRVPTLISTAAIIAGVQTQEAVKLLHNMPIPPASGFLYDGLGSKAMNVEFAERSSCLAHTRWTPIIQLDTRARTATVGDLLSAAQRVLGSEARLHLDRDVLLRQVCYSCGHEQQLVQPVNPPLPDDVRCEACGERCIPDVRHVIDGDAVRLETRLSDLGVPPLQIVRARAGSSSAYFELSADAAEVLDWEEHTPHE